MVDIPHPLLRVGGLFGCFGGHSVGETPGSIPNPVAKPSCADGTALGRVWESRTPPNYSFVGVSPGLVVGAHTYLTPEFLEPIPVSLGSGFSFAFMRLLASSVCLPIVLPAWGIEAAS